VFELHRGKPAFQELAEDATRRNARELPGVAGQDDPRAVTLGHPEEFKHVPRADHARFIQKPDFRDSGGGRFGQKVALKGYGVKAIGLERLGDGKGGGERPDPGPFLPGKVSKAPKHKGLSRTGFAVNGGDLVSPVAR
jgi:hypothetical protein